MESISLLLNEALSPYPVTLAPPGSHGECLLTVNSHAGLVLLSREISHAQLNDKRLLIDVVDGLHRDLRIAEGRLQPCVVEALRHAARYKVFRPAAL